MLILKSTKVGTSYNRTTNTEYVYENSTYYDDEADKLVYKRRLIGKIDPVTGEQIPTGSVGRPRMERPVRGSSADENSEQHKQHKETAAAAGQQAADPDCIRDVQSILDSIQKLSEAIANTQKALEHFVQTYR